MRQSSEWGMRQIQASFPRLCGRFIHEGQGERKLNIVLRAYLFNLGSQKTGISQIKNVYMPMLEKYDLSL